MSPFSAHARSAAEVIHHESGIFPTAGTRRRSERVADERRQESFGTAGDDIVRSFRSGVIQSVRNPATIADGARTAAPGEITFLLIMHYVDDMLTVDDAELLRAMWYPWERLKLVVEPRGALAAGALLEGKLDARGKRAGIVISGGNADQQQLCALL